jgi:hypothetical protein
MSTQLSNELSGLECAKYYKFFAQDLNPKIIYKLPFSRITAVSLYNKNKKLFDNLSNRFNKFKIDIPNFLGWFIRTYGDVKSKILNSSTLSEYAAYIQVIEKYKIIFKTVIKNSEYIANESIKAGYSSCELYFKDLLKDNKIGILFLSGKVSEWWLSAVPNIKSYLSQCDNLTKDTINPSEFNFDKLYADVQSAFDYLKKIRFNSFKFTDKLIEKFSQR